MKKLITLFVLIASINGLKAQIINFPDANFKIKLLSANSTQTGTNIVATDNIGNAITIDLNSDNEVSIQEALLVYKLNLDQASITNLSGIENFTNLLQLECSNNQISSFTIGNLSNLSKLNCSQNQLTSIDLTTNSNIHFLELSYNPLTQLNISNLNNLDTLGCRSNQLTSLNLTPFNKLKLLAIDNNSISTIDLSNNTKLTSFTCRGNLLSSINLSYTPILESLFCSANQLTSIDLSNQTKLKYLDCGSNQIVTINTSFCSELINFYCNYGKHTSIDISQNKRLYYLGCSNNTNLTSLNLKNGKNIAVFFDGNPNLKYICIDSIQLDTINTYLPFYNYSNLEVNTYCTFKPGGDFNTISGRFNFDINNNGCDINDPNIIPNAKVSIQGLNLLGTTFSNKDGLYSLYTPKGTFTISPTCENPTYFSFTPQPATITFLDSLNNTTIQDFCITPIGSHADVEVVLNPIQRARPGFDAQYQLVYKNKGNQTLSGTVNLLFNDSLIDFLSSSITPIASSVGNLTWDYTTLLPFEVKTIDLTFNVNSPAEIPAVNIGDTLKFTATITPVTGDETPLDNVFNFNQIVVGAYDPNEVTCLEGDIIPPSSIGQYLHYTIDFENTGNYPAENVVVKEIIDPKEFDIKTLQILNSSDKMYTRIKGNQIEYIFEGIQLEEHNHGNILFKLKTRDTLTLGDSVLKSADIYFDYNLPVQTNNSKTTFQNLTVGLMEKMIDQSITVFPNPSNGVYNIRSKNQTKQVEVFDASGRLLLMKIGSDNSSKVDITNQEQGIYFLKITTDKGVKVMEVSKN